MQVVAGLCGVSLCTSPGCIGVQKGKVCVQASTHHQGGMGCIPVGDTRTCTEIRPNAKCHDSVYIIGQSMGCLLGLAAAEVSLL